MFWCVSTLLWGLFLAAGCNAPTPAPTGDPAKTGSSGEPAAGAESSATEKSKGNPATKDKRRGAGGPKVLYELPEFQLVDQQGAPFGTGDLAGKVWIANFMFTRCKATCPVQTAKLAEFQRQAQRWPDWNRVRLVSISVDPDHDTPEVLTQYSATYQADPDNWKFLTGSRDAIWKLSKDGFKLPVAESADEAGPIAHSPRFILIDSQRRVRGFYDSQQDRDVRQLAIDLRHVLEETPDPDRSVTHVALPREVFYAPWMEGRRAAQLAGAGQLEVRHDFSYSDQLSASGVTFVSRVVGDAARAWKMNHYDHANGLAAADVDGDGRIDLYFLSQVGGCELWRNVGNARFENITARSGVAIPDRVVVSASFADTDNDGDPDLFVTTTRQGNLFFVNDGQGNFADATESSGLGYVGHSSTGEFFDYDRDGRLDLFVTNVGKFTTETVGYSGVPGSQEGAYFVGADDAFVGHLHPDRAEASLLYHNEGDNRFRDVSAELELEELSWSGDATPFDGNDDGWPDLYVLNMQGTDQYYENEGGQRFVRKTRERFPKVPWGGMGVKAFDFDNDAGLDLLVTNMHVDMWAKFESGSQEKQKAKLHLMPVSYLRNEDPSTMILGNALFQRQAGGVYSDVSDERNAETYWPWGVSAGDLNADGWQDVFVTASMNLQYRYHPNGVLLNDHGRRFVDAEFLLGVEPRADGRLAVPWYEADCDGADAGTSVCEGHTGRVVVWGAVGSRSSLIVDLDQDGDLDIVTADFNSPPQILLSDLAGRSPAPHRLEISLRGTRSNRDGLGAKVLVTAGGQTQLQVHDGQSGYLSQSSLPLYFGLGTATTVDRIVVRWPSGGEQTLEGPLDADRRLLITETE